MSIASLASAWWQYTSSGSGGTDSVAFFPGSNYNVDCSGAHCDGFTAGSFPYGAIGGSLGGLYAGVFSLLVAVAVLLGLAALFTGLGALGYAKSGTYRFLTFVFSITSLGLLLAAVGWTASGQPGDFPSGSLFTGDGSGSNSPSSSFWGSTSTGSASWGAGAGWYLALACAVLLLVVLIMLVIVGRARPGPVERPSRSTVSAPPVPPKGYTAPPPAARPAPYRGNGGRSVAPATPPSAPSAAPAATSSTPPVSASAVPAAPAAAETTACPTCGIQNPAKSRTCSYCQTRLR
jgi:hypothetical protein